MMAIVFQVLATLNIDAGETGTLCVVPTTEPTSIHA